MTEKQVGKIIHHLPGRVRIAVPGLFRNKELALVLEKRLIKVKGVSSVKINTTTGTVLIIFDTTMLNADRVQKEIAQFVIKWRSEEGFGTGTGEKRLGVKEPEDLPIGAQITQVAFTGLVLLVLTLKRIFFGKSKLAGSTKLFNLAAVTSIVAGYPILRSGLESLTKERRLNNDLLIAVATLVSLILRESLTGLVVVWLVNLSTLFQTLTLERSRRAIRELFDGKNENAWLLVDGSQVSVPLESIKIGDIVAIHTGEKIPVDGEVCHGSAAVNQAPITGESVPVLKRVGDTVFAGTMVEQGCIQVRSQKVGDDTAMARIIHLVEEASEARAPIQNLADSYSQKIVPLSFALSALVFLLTRDIYRSMTILIVACPCAAGLSTPTAISAAMGNAASRGILIKGGSYLENTGRVDTVLFDKTGTLTEGKPRVTEYLSLRKDFPGEQVVALTAAAEMHTNHPLAGVILDKAAELNLQVPICEEKDLVVGRGIKAVVEGSSVLIGNEKLLEEESINSPQGKVKAARLRHLGNTVIYVARDGELIGLLGVQDTIRPESNRAVRKLRAEGIERIGLLSGDTRECAV